MSSGELPRGRPGVPAHVSEGETLAQSESGTSSPLTSTSPSLLGAQFDDFEVLQEIGRGGMGVVFKAHQKSLDRPVALKMLLSQALQDEIRLARFITEARASASLNHPNIVQIFHVGQCFAGPYFAMELIEGESLESILKRGRLSVMSAVSLVALLAETVHYAHTRGIVHRDLKPANIMLHGNQRPVVMDFGIAKLMGQATALTQQGMVMGTPAFMAPEQAGEQMDRVGPLSDVYALSAIFYNLLTGRPPYEEATPLKTVLKVISDDKPIPVRQLRPEVPEIFQQICMKGLSKDPDSRYPSAYSLCDHLRRAKSSLLAKGRPNPTKKPGESSIAENRGPEAVAAGLPNVALVANATGRQIRITSAQTILGRAAECGIVLKSSDVSKQHCRILLENGQAIVEDLESANGVHVNGEPVQRARLKDGDLLTIARYEFTFRILK